MVNITNVGFLLDRLASVPETADVMTKVLGWNYSVPWDGATLPVNYTWAPSKPQAIQTLGFPDRYFYMENVHTVYKVCPQ